MVRFEELQELWQHHAPSEAPQVAAESRAMAAALRRFRRRQRIINVLKLVVIVSITGFFLSRLRISALTLLGEGLFLAGMITMVVTDWRIQSAVARLDFTDPSAGFVNATLGKLRHPNAPFRRIGWLGIALVAAGVNLMYAVPSAIQTLAARIGSHTTATLFLVVVFAIGLKLRARRYAMDYKPMVERLEAIRAALEERAQ